MVTLRKTLHTLLSLSLAFASPAMAYDATAPSRTEAIAAQNDAASEAQEENAEGASSQGNTTEVVIPEPAKAEITVTLEDFTYPLLYDIHVFVSDYNKSHSSVAISEEIMKSNIETYGAYTTMQQGLEFKNEPEKVKYSEDAIEQIWATNKVKRQWSSRAYALVYSLFEDHHLVDINNMIREMLAEFVMEPTRRDGLGQILRTIGQFKFSDAQKKRMEKERSEFFQWTTGFEITSITLVVGSWLFASRMRVTQGWKYAVEVTQKYFSQFGKRAKNQADEVVEDTAKAMERATPEGLIPLDELAPGYKDIHLNGLSEEKVFKVIVKASAKKLKDRILTLDLKRAIFNALGILGVSSAAGGANVGWHAFYKYVYGEDFIMNRYLINPDDYQADYYDALATLALECRSKRLYEESKTIDLADVPALTQFGRTWNELFLERIQLEVINSYYLIRRELPENITIDKKTGKVNFLMADRQTGEPTELNFMCESRKGLEPPHHTGTKAAIENLEDARDHILERLAEKIKADKAAEEGDEPATDEANSKGEDSTAEPTDGSASFNFVKREVTHA